MMDPPPVSSLAGALTRLTEQWVAVVELLRRYGAEGEARALERAITDVREAISRADEELLTLTAAALESGYSRDYLGELLRKRPELNAGRPNAPRIRRRDVPRKASALPSAPALRMVPGTRTQIARAVACTLTPEHGDG
jgi:hypothetical protein